jgi:hypothetical protein
LKSKSSEKIKFKKKDFNVYLITLKAKSLEHPAKLFNFPISLFEIPPPIAFWGGGGLVYLPPPTKRGQ